MSSSIEDALCEAIEYIVSNAVESAGYDRTIQATIVECTDATIGKYKVKYQDSSFYAYSQSTDVTYTSGSEVYVLIPNNDMSRDKTILGTTAKLGSNYATVAEGDEAYEVIGTNCIESSETFGLCSYLSDMVEIIYDKEDSSKNQISLNLTAVETYLKQSESIICGATIKTDLPVEQQFRGNYGIIFELNFADNATGTTVTKNYVVDVNQMTGNPYNISRYTRQYGIFDIDSENFIDVNRIYLFVYDFPNKSTEMPEDIFIKDIELSGANVLTEEELSSCALTFVTPQGIYFDDNDLDSATRSIQAEVRVKGKVVDVNSQSLTYYWFVENVGVSTKSEKYNKYGGAGWACLNDYNIIKSEDGDDAAVVEWVPGTYEYIVTKSDSAAKETKYKCVVLYDSLTLSKEITIINFSSDYLISIESDSGTQFYFDIGTPTLTCKINDTEQVTDDYTYVWAEVDNNNNFFSLSETEEDNLIYNNAVAAYEALQAAVDAGTSLPAASQEELEEYLTIIKNYDTIMRVEKNKLHKVQINEITSFSTYKCSVFYKGVFIGTSSIVLLNSLDAEGVYTIIINNGSQVFKYNENGVSPTSDTVEDPYEIPALSFVVYDNLGNQISDDVLEKCDIQWIVPTENTMISIPSVFSANRTSVDLINGTETYSDLLTFSYTISEKYYVTRTNNNIQLVVNYKDMLLTTTTNFTFAKEGDPGTNGTEFLCRILPNVATGDAPEYPMLLNGTLNYTPRQSGRWFKVQMWHSGELIFDGVESGSTEEGKTLAIVWSMLKNTYSSSISDDSDIDINAATGYCTYNGYTNGSTPANIVKCTISYDGVEYYATMPLITATSSTGYAVELKEGTGFRFATYSADGRRPQYDNTNPFELIVTQTIDGYEEDITYMTNDYEVAYQWEIKGQIYNTVSKAWESNINLGLKSSRDTYDTNPIEIKPLDEYNGECLTNALECVITQSDTEVARIHIPIHLLLNRYGHAALNSWDGNSVSIDADGSGVILAPQIGAGIKESDNSFTGMVMGQVKEADQSNADVGLIGYHQGQRTLHLSAYDGYAIFGKNGPGQIILDPSSSYAMLYSNNFWADYYDDNSDSNRNGLPQTTYVYNSSTNKYNGQSNTSTSDMQDSNSGMIIDLTTPRILFGSGNFRVDPNGFVYAKGGGQIAGWKINDYRIDSIDRGTSSTVTGRTGMSSIYDTSADGVTTESTKIPDSSSSSGYTTETKAVAFWAGDDEFYVTHDGYLKANEASIGSGTNPIFIGRSSGSSSYSALFSGKKSSFDSDNSGFYIGTDGIALGTHNSSGESKFQVTSAGVLTAREGTIGGWTIGRTSLSAGNVTMTSSGNITCTGGSGWYIYSNGSASFGNLYISSSGDITANGGTFNNITANGGTFTNITASGGTFSSVTVSGTINATSGVFQNCTIADSCTIGGVRVDSTFVQNANIASSAVTSGKIATGAVTADKISVSTLSAITANLGLVNLGDSSYIDGNNDAIQITNSVGFFSMGVVSNHPWMSAVNVYAGNGILFRNSSSVTDTMDSLGSIRNESQTMIINGSNAIRFIGRLYTQPDIAYTNTYSTVEYQQLHCEDAYGDDMLLTFRNGLLCGADNI